MQVEGGVWRHWWGVEQERGDQKRIETLPEFQYCKQMRSCAILRIYEMVVPAEACEEEKFGGVRGGRRIRTVVCIRSS